MKRIKKFINYFKSESRYKVGDYVLCNYTYVNNGMYNKNIPVKIVDTDNKYGYYQYKVYSKFISDLIGETDREYIWIIDGDIISKLSKEEYDDLHIPLTQNKFNL